MRPLSLPVVMVWASTIFWANSLTAGEVARCSAIFPAVTSYMSLMAAARTKPLVVDVISAEIWPTRP